MRLIDPVTRQELPAIPGERPKDHSFLSHWRTERAEDGTPLRMYFAFCDDPNCCPPFPASACERAGA